MEDLASECVSDHPSQAQAKLWEEGLKGENGSVAGIWLDIQ